MKLVKLRGEEPPGDAAVVIRGGANSLSIDAVVRSAGRNMTAFGFHGLSVFVAADDEVVDLCGSVDELRRYGQIRRSTVVRITSSGFALLATGAAPHYDVVLPDLAPSTLERLVACFDDPERNPGRGR
ncbi:MAG: hypothetical protein ABIV94_08685 [Acidimicrobiales bacterium]